MPAVTVDQVKALTSTVIPDDVVSGIIASVNDKIGACLDVSYPAETADLLALYAVSHFVEISKGQTVSSTRAPNGASVSYDNTMSNGDGLLSTSYGKVLYQLDTANCSAELINNSFLIGTAGNVSASQNPDGLFVL